MFNLRFSAPIVFREVKCPVVEWKPDTAFLSITLSWINDVNPHETVFPARPPWVPSLPPLNHHVWPSHGSILLGSANGKRWAATPPVPWSCLQRPGCCSHIAGPAAMQERRWLCWRWHSNHLNLLPASTIPDQSQFFSQNFQWQSNSSCYKFKTFLSGQIEYLLVGSN